jgi:hypothetical protein
VREISIDHLGLVGGSVVLVVYRKKAYSAVVDQDIPYATGYSIPITDSKDLRGSSRLATK